MDIWMFFCFPIPLTVLIWKSTWSKKTKIIVTAVMWLFILICGYVSEDEDYNSVNTVSNNVLQNIVESNVENNINTLGDI